MTFEVADHEVRGFLANLLKPPRAVTRPTSKRKAVTAGEGRERERKKRQQQHRKSSDIEKMEARKSTKTMTRKELLKEPNKHASLVIRYKEESLYLDAMFMSQHCGLVRDFIYQKEGRLALDDGGASVDSGVFVDNLCFQEDDDDDASKSKDADTDEPAHAARMRIPDDFSSVSWAAIVDVVVLCCDSSYASQDGCSLDSRPFEADDIKSAEGEPAVVDKYALLKAARFLQATGVSRLIEKSLIRSLDKYLTKEAPQVHMSFVPEESVTTHVDVLDLVIREAARASDKSAETVKSDHHFYDGCGTFWKLTDVLKDFASFKVNVPVKYPVPVGRPAAKLGDADDRVKLCFVFADEFHLSEAWSTLLQIVSEQKESSSTVDFLKGVIGSSEYGSRISAKAQVEMLMALH